MYVDFAEVKARTPIAEAVKLLELEMKQSGNQLRGRCPVCDTDDDRALVVTPEKNVYYCHTDKRGGDVISLVAHIRGTSMKEAAQFLAGDRPAPAAPSPEDDVRAGTLTPLDYLEHEHKAVQALGLDAETAKALGIGYAKKGLMRGHVAVPIWKEGALAGYIGVKEAKLPPRWHV